MSARGAAAVAAALDGDDPEARRQAVARLGEIAPADAIPLLLRALGDPEWRVRKEATNAGRQLFRAVSAADAGPPDAPGQRPLVDALVAALGPSDNVGLRNAATDLLAGFGAAATPALAAAMPALDADGRKLAVEALGRSRDPAALAALERALSDTDDNVRQAAVEAIAAMGPVAREAVTPLLLRCLGDRDRFVRLTALHGLNGVEAVVPWERLAALLDDPMLRPVALTAAALAESEEAPAALVDALGVARGSAFGQALWALARLAEGPLAPHVVEALRAAGDDVGGRLVRAASEAPGPEPPGAGEPPSFRGPTSEPGGARGKALILAALAQAPGAARAAVRALADPALADAAQRALSLLGPRALPELLVHLTQADLDEDVEAALVDVVVGIGHDGASGDLPRAELRAALRCAVRSPSSLVATSALYGLARLGADDDLPLVAELVVGGALAAARAAERALAALALRHPAAARALCRALGQREETYLPAAIVLDALGVEGHEDTAFLAHAARAGDARARGAAVRAIASAAAAASLEVLSLALADEERQVQLAAARAVGHVHAALERAPDSGGACARAAELLDLVRRSGDHDLVAAAAQGRAGVTGQDLGEGGSSAWKAT